MRRCCDARVRLSAAAAGIAVAWLALVFGAPALANTLAGKVVGTGKPVAGSNVPVWAARSSNFAGESLTELCGARAEACQPGFKTGDAISSAGGYVGGGMQLLTGVAIDPAGNVWLVDNWQRPDSCFARDASEARSTLCSGNGPTVFHGMAKPVRAPQTGPSQPVRGQ